MDTIARPLLVVERARKLLPQRLEFRLIAGCDQVNYAALEHLHHGKARTKQTPQVTYDRIEYSTNSISTVARDDIRQGRRTVPELKEMLEKNLSTTYGVSRDTARRARKAVLSESSAD